jgi:hypothetical protein
VRAEFRVIDEGVRQRAVTERAEQGLPPTVHDLGTLDRIGLLVGSALLGLPADTHQLGVEALQALDRRKEGHPLNDQRQQRPAASQ